MTKFLNYIMLLAFITLLASCGGSSGGSSSSNNDAGEGTTAVEIAGKVMDGYIQNAEVFLDLNSNLKKDAGEPSTISDENGDYKLDISDYSGAKSTGTVVAMIGKKAIDADTGYGFSSTFSMTSIPGEKHINPLTTMARNLGGEKVTKAEADELLKELMGEDIDVSEDYVANSKTGDDTQKTRAKKIHKQAQVIARLQAKLNKDYENVSDIDESNKQKLIANLIAKKSEEIKAEAEKIADDETANDSVADKFDIEVTTDTKSLKDRVEKIDNRKKVKLKNSIRWLSMIHYDQVGVSQQGSYVKVQFAPKPELSTQTHSFKVEKEGVSHTLVSLGNNIWIFDKADGMTNGTWNLILTKKGDGTAGDSTAVIATAKLEDGSEFFSNVENESADQLNIIVDQNDRVKSVAWSRKSTANVKVYARMTVRPKDSTQLRWYGSRTEEGGLMYLANEAKNTTASALEYRLELWDGRNFAESNALKKLTPWESFPAPSTDAFFEWYRMHYDDRAVSPTAYKRTPVFQFGVSNADAVKKIIYKLDDEVIYSSTLNISYADKTCNGANVVSNTGVELVSQVDSQLFTLSCDSFLVEGDDGYVADSNQLDFWSSSKANESTAVANYIQTSIPDGKYSIELLDADDKVMSQVTRHLKNTQKLSRSSEEKPSIKVNGKGFIKFSWAKLSTTAVKVYYRAEFMMYKDGEYDSWLFSTGREKQNYAVIQQKHFYNKAQKFCDAVAKDSSLELRLRISAFDNKSNHLINERVRSDVYSLTYGCSASSAPSLVK